MNSDSPIPDQAASSHLAADSVAPDSKVPDPEMPDHASPKPMVPGEILFAAGDIELNAGQSLLTVEVANNGEQPVALGSHYHVAEANPALEFNREAARGYRLDIPAGTTLRLEPGQRRMLDLIPYGGSRELYGFRGEVMGALDAPPAEGSSESAPARATAG